MAGTDAVEATFTGQRGEYVYDTTNSKLVVNVPTKLRSQVQLSVGVSTADTAIPSTTDVNVAVTGTDYADTIVTGGGDSIPVARADSLTGGAGADVFTIANADAGITVATADTIADFVSGTDTIDLAGAAGTESNYAEPMVRNANLTAVISDADLPLTAPLFTGEYNVAGGGDGYLL